MGVAHWWFMLPLRLRSIFRRRQVEREIVDELDFHLEHKIEEGLASGLSAAEARRGAMRAMGGLEQRKEEMREALRVHWLTDFVADVRYAFRSLRRTPALSILVVVTLAFGIGLTAAPFSMLDALVFRPYPVPDPAEVVNLVATSRDDAYGQFSHREYLDIRTQAKSYDGVLASTAPRAVGFAAVPGDRPQVRTGMLVSGNYFRALGVEPSIGRGFRDGEDEVPGRDAVVVLGPDFWQRELGGDPSVVGRVVRLNGTDFTVVGVAPESFPGLLIFTRPDLYIPLAMAPVFSTDPQKDFFEDRDDRELAVRGRLRHGVALRQAKDELAAIAQGFARQHPELYRERGAAVRTFFDIRTRGDDVNWKFSVVFSVLGVAVLLVACTNVAGLLLSRARTRTREVAIRLSMGAWRFRLVRLLLTESLVLALAGGVGGVALGYVAIELLQRFSIPSELPLTIPFRMDARVLMASLAVAVATAVASGLAPALQSTRTDLVGGLKTADVDLPGRSGLWGRKALVVAQVAMSLMLLTVTILMARSFRETAVRGAVEGRDHLLMVRLDPRLAQYDAARTERFYDDLTARVREAPGVRGVGLTHDPPLGLGSFPALAYVPEGVQLPPDRESLVAPMDAVDEGFFAAMEVPILAGRGFLATDTAETPRVAVVNEHLARRHWPRGDAVGRRIRLDRRGGTAVEIVGVARTVAYASPGETPADFVYLPLAQHPMARMVLLVHTTGDPLQLAGPVREIVRALDPDLPILETRTYQDLVRYHTVDGPGVAIRMVGTMGAVALVLAIAGLYGLMAYNVTRRTREIGIRMAIGAAPAQVLLATMRQGLALVALGAALGLTMGYGVERLMDSMIFETPGMDVAAYAVMVPAMAAVILLAAWLPARRAARISPTRALRYE
jgi:predicted permease